MRSKLIAAGTGLVLVAGVIWTAQSVGAQNTPEPEVSTVTRTSNGMSTTITTVRGTRGLARAAEARSARARSARPPGGVALGPPVSQGGVGADFDGDGTGDVVTGADMAITSDEDETWRGPGVVVEFFPFAEEAFVQYIGGDGFQGPVPSTGAHVSFAAGDFNSDSFDDLAIGLPRSEQPSAGASMGFVWVYFGSPTGLGQGDAPVVFFSQDDLPDAHEDAEAGDMFGHSMAAGDLNHDTFYDLIIGSPGEGLGATKPSVGAISVIYGTEDGLDLDGAEFLTQDSPGVEGGAETGDLFGFAVAAGDATGDNFDDVVVGAPGENGVGGITLLTGGAGTSFPVASTGRVAPTTATVKPKRMGETVLIAGLFSGGTFLAQEVLAGDPSATVSGKTTAGAVSVWIGRSTGLSNTGREWWHQNRANVPGAAETGDRFGSALNVAPLYGDPSSELVVGVPNEDIGSLNSAGAITILTGVNSGTGLTGTGSMTISQNSAGVTGGAETNDRFGASLQSYFYLDQLWLEVGSPGEQINDIAAPGSGSRHSFVRITEEGNESFGPVGGLPAGEDYTVVEGGETVIYIRSFGMESLQS